jgi:hypothetical protein
MTMQTFLAGLYPPVDWSKWNANVNWQPIPIGINDELLQIKKIDDCIAEKEAWNAATSAKAPAVKELLESNKVMLHHQTNF